MVATNMVAWNRDELDEAERPWPGNRRFDVTAE